MPFIKTPTMNNMIFIVGCYNSGTTLLDHMLSSHDEISNLPSEGVSLTSELSTPEDFGWNRMWFMCRNKLEISKFSHSPDLEIIKKQWSMFYDNSKEFYLEKSVINSLNIDWLEESFHSPYFIWIVRNGYAVAEGIRRRTLPEGRHNSQYLKGYPIELCAKQWAYNNNVISKKINYTKNWKCISYEDLTTKNDAVIDEIFDWLPLNERTEYNITREFTFHNKSKTITNMNQESINRLSKIEIDQITSEIQPELVKYGYKILKSVL